MKQKLNLLISTLALLVLFAACNTAVPSPVNEGPFVSTLPVLPTETAISTSTPAIVLTTYQDTASGFSFDYPAGWMLDEIALGSRAPVGYQITSWSHDPGMISEVPADGTIIDIAVQLWDPKGDLSAFFEHRKQAWDASGITIAKTEDITLGNNMPAKILIINGADGSEGYVLLSTLGENYLVVSGNGDLQKIDLVARSIR
jgi:hypothetical protein